MAENGRRRGSADRAGAEPVRPGPRSLIGLLRRVIAPRSPAVLVMERDGRLVCAHSIDKVTR